MGALSGPPLRGFLVGFSATLLVAILVATFASFALAMANQGRVLPGVSVAGVRLGGLDRDAAEARLRATLPSLSSGAATLVVEGQSTVVPYAEIGRGYELEAMADLAYGTGREANPVAAGISLLRDALRGTAIPVEVHAFDLDAINRVAIRLALQHDREPIDAAVTRADDGSLSVTGATAGTSLDPRVVRSLLGAAVGSSDPGNMTVQIPVTVRQPAVSTAQALAAADAGRAMVGSALTLTDGSDDFVVEPAQLAGVLRFEIDAGGRYWPSIDAVGLGNLVTSLAATIDREPKDASYRFAATIEVIPAVAGRALDQAGATAAIRDALAARAAGDDPGRVSVPVAVTQPTLTTEAAKASVDKIVRISTWTTYYIPGISNGYGVNISIPARKLNGFVVAPGETFDFWHDIGPVTTAQGYTVGGAIINGKSEPTGALAGGICSTSTTLFNAALRAGLQMGARTNHSYYISRYPVGLDATVFADGNSVTTMSWTNDTPYPIIIRSVTAYGIVRFDLYSVPTGRRVTLTTPIITNRVYAHDVIQYTTALKPGVSRRVEGVYNGFDARVTRYVRDAAGHLIHTDTYFSHYHAVNGLLLVGKSSTATPPPSPTPTPVPTASPSPAP